MDTETEIRRIARLLEIEIRRTGTTKRAIEKKLGWAGGYLTKVVKGGLELRLRHILAVAEAAGFDVAAFFEEAFPPTVAPGRRGREERARGRQLEQAIDRALARRFEALHAQLAELQEALEEGRASTARRQRQK